MKDLQIRLDRRGPVAVLTLNRPAVLNALSLEAFKELLRGIEQVRRDRTCRALILTGSGRAFCAGWQLGDEIPGLPGESVGSRQKHLMEEYFNPVVVALNDLPVPVVAAVNGVAAGGGVSLALAADIVVASRSASFSMAFAPMLGLIPDLGATWKLPRLIGWARAVAVTMLGERVTAEQAVQWGMIWQAVDDAELMPSAHRLSTALASCPQDVCKELRQAFHHGQSAGLADQLEDERKRQCKRLDLPSFAEGVLAFKQKRAPRFHDAL